MSRKINESLLRAFEAELLMNEKSEATVEKYRRDLRAFANFAGTAETDKNLLLNYKEYLGQRYAVSSANSMIAALNVFLRFCGWGDLCLRQFRVQREAYCSEEKELSREEYVRLVKTAQRNGNARLSLILQTICGTGIRVSELQYVTVESLQKGEAIVRCKGKSRRIFLVPELRSKLLRYRKETGIESGSLFVGSDGRPMSRNRIWREMKNLCEKARVDSRKVFPHNLRHLFARIFYALEKDIAKLSDLLGHASINTTRIYIVTTGTEHRKKMEQMHLIL